jgi:hypothetical protein
LQTTTTMIVILMLLMHHLNLRWVMIVMHLPHQKDMVTEM